MERQHRAELTVSQAGRMGGLETRRRGQSYYAEIGRAGQVVFITRYTREDRSRWGKLGGRPRRQRYMGEEANLSEGGKGTRPVN